VNVPLLPKERLIIDKDARSGGAASTGGIRLGGWRLSELNFELLLGSTGHVEFQFRLWWFFDFGLRIRKLSFEHFLE
jgi:hypothetical protein